MEARRHRDTKTERNQFLLSVSLYFCVLVLNQPVHALENEKQSEWVHPGPDGKLVYKTTPAGDRILDFSHAGYMGGGVALPEVPVAVTVKPSGGDDDSKLIQDAIDQVEALPMKDGFRGAVKLAAGTFNCGKALTINASGV